LHQEAERYADKGHMTKTANFHFEIVKSPYLSEKSSDFNKIWCITAYIEPDYSHVTKNWNF